MKVRILSGNQAGAVVEMREDEADAALATGFGESAEPSPVTPEDEEEKDAEPKRRKIGRPTKRTKKGR